MSTAATVESTPPERPQSTRSVPTFRRISSTMSRIQSSSRQEGSQRHTWKRKRRRISVPCSVWATSGWNCRAPMRPSPISKPARAPPSLAPTARAPGGSAVTWSQWLIQTWKDEGSPSRSTEGSSVRHTRARPYSAAPARSTRPPS